MTSGHTLALADIRQHTLGQSIACWIIRCRTTQTGYSISVLGWGLRKEREQNVKLSRHMPAGREPKPSKTSVKYFCPFLPTLANSELRLAWTQAVRANRLRNSPAVTVQKGHTNTLTCSPRFPCLPSGRCLCCHLSLPPLAASSKLTPSLLTVCLTKCAPVSSGILSSCLLR